MGLSDKMLELLTALSPMIVAVLGFAGIVVQIYFGQRRATNEGNGRTTSQKIVANLPGKSLTTLLVFVLILSGGHLYYDLQVRTANNQITGPDIASKEAGQLPDFRHLQDSLRSQAENISILQSEKSQLADVIDSWEQKHVTDSTLIDGINAENSKLSEQVTDLSDDVSQLRQVVRNRDNRLAARHVTIKNLIKTGNGLVDILIFTPDPDDACIKSALQKLRQAGFTSIDVQPTINVSQNRITFFKNEVKSIAENCLAEITKLACFSASINIVKEQNLDFAHKISIMLK